MLKFANSQTIELPQQDILHDTVFNSDGALEAGVKFKLPALLLKPMASHEDAEGTFLAILRSVVGVGERLRLTVRSQRHSHDQFAEAYKRHRKMDDDKIRWLTEQNLEAWQASDEAEPVQTIDSFMTVTQRLPVSRWTKLTGAPVTVEEKIFDRYHQRLMRQREEAAQYLEHGGFRPEMIDNQGAFDRMWLHFNPAYGQVMPPKYVRQSKFFSARDVQKHTEAAPETLRSRLTQSPRRLYGDKPYFSLGGTFVSVIALEDWPNEGTTWTGMLNLVLAQDCPYEVVIDFQQVPREDYLRVLEVDAARYQKSMTDEIYGGGNVTAEEGFKNSRETIRKALSSGSYFYKVGFSIILYNDNFTKLERSRNKIMSQINTIGGFKWRVKHIGKWQQYKTLSPFSGKMNDINDVIFDDNACAIIPLSDQWVGNDLPVFVSRNRWGGKTNINPFDSGLDNSNAVVLAPPGSGKSYMMGLLMNDVMATGADVVMVEPDRNYVPLVEYLGGAHYEIAPDGRGTRNIMDLRPGQVEPDAAQLGFISAAVATMIRSTNGVITGNSTLLIQEAARKTYQGKTDEFEGEGGRIERRLTGTPLLRDLVERLLRMQTVGRNETARDMTEQERTEATNLGNQLSGWIGDSTYGPFVDRPTNLDITNRLLYFDMSKIRDNKELAPIGYLLLAKAVWDRLNTARLNPLLAIFDEIKAISEFQEARAMLADFANRVRKKNAGLYVIAQSISHLSDELATIPQTASSLYLINMAKEAPELVKRFNLPEAAAEIISKVQPKQEMLVLQQQGSTYAGEIIDPVVSPALHWLLTSHGPEVALRERYRERHGSLEAAIEALVKDFPKGYRGHEHEEETMRVLAQVAA